MLEQLLLVMWGTAVVQDEAAVLTVLSEYYSNLYHHPLIATIYQTPLIAILPNASHSNPSAFSLPSLQFHPKLSDSPVLSVYADFYSLDLFEQ